MIIMIIIISYVKDPFLKYLLFEGEFTLNNSRVMLVPLIMIWSVNVGVEALKKCSD